MNSPKSKVQSPESKAKNGKRTRYARTTKEIARALGLKTTPKQRTEVGEWRQRDDFPTKTPKGWLVEDLRVFFDKITPELALRKFRAQLADPESKLSPSEFNKLVELSAGAVQSTVAARPETGTRPLMPATPPEIVQGLTRLATWIQSVYQIPCSKQTIKNWQTEVPPFPGAESADYRYRWSLVSAWVERYKVKPMAGHQNYADLLIKLEPERIQGELEEIAHDRMLRAVDAGQYLKKGDVARACQGLGKTINGIINNRLELRLRVAAIERFAQKAEIWKAESRNLTEGQVAGVVDVFCELGRETSAALKAELRTALNQLGSEPEKPLMDTDNSEVSSGAKTP